MVADLTPDTCYRFTLRALVGDAGWISADAVAVATAATSAADLPSLAAELALVRSRLLDSALAEVTMDPCPLSGYARPSYVGGDGDAVSFRGALDRTSDVGAAAAAVTCALAECSPRIDDTAPAGPGVQGLLAVAQGSDWQLGAAPQFTDRFVALPPGKTSITYTAPESASMRTSISLIGCRAAPSVHAAQPPPQPRISR